MYLTYNEDKSLVPERFKETYICKKIIVNDSKSYLRYLNKLFDKYNNTYHRSIVKKPIDSDYSVLSEEIHTKPNAPKFKVGDRVRIKKHKKIFSKG